jgi:acetyltransferase-like isoleucine patch superfamily enzyme
VREAPIHIGDGTWVGARAIILPGVTIGRRCLIAAGAVVSRDVPDDTLVAGNPARVVRDLVYPDGVTRAWHN